MRRPQRRAARLRRQGAQGAGRHTARPQKQPRACHWGGHERATTSAADGNILESTTGSTDSGPRTSFSTASHRILVLHCSAAAAWLLGSAWGRNARAQGAGRWESMCVDPMAFSL
jgi:hypothetical protein